MDEPFVGAKLALFLGPRLLVYRRDNLPGLLAADMWDLPGGGREDAETPETCVIRETQEEFALHVPPSALICKTRYEGAMGAAYFFAAQLPGDLAASIRFSDEGQYWELWPAALFAAHPNAVRTCQGQVQNLLAGGFRSG